MEKAWLIVDASFFFSMWWMQVACAFKKLKNSAMNVAKAKSVISVS